MKKRIYHIILILVGSFFSLSAQDWRQIVTVQDVFDAYPDKMKEMIESFDLGHPGLEYVKKAVANDDLITACTALLDYYTHGQSTSHLRRALPEVTTSTIPQADSILENIFVIQNVRGQVPWRDDGHRDWYYKGPNNDREWAWLSNRHSQINLVLQAFYKTGNPKYAQYIDLFLKDFIIASMPYPATKSITSVWRGLEVAARAKVWPRVFFGLQNSGFLSPATRLLILSSLPDHAHYNRNFHGNNNWLTMEISALATVATDFPEYKKSQEWLDYAAHTITESMKGQVYPDGVQTELTSHYHTVAMRNFSLFKDICDRANYSLPDFFNETIENMYRYTAHTVRPDGYGILNNDGDRTMDVQIILQGANKYNHPEWTYIATNGKEGVKPDNGPSYFFPWAGQLVSRSGYKEEAHWSFFDIGPWGSGHQHNDKLHLSVSAYGRDFLFDAGRFAYNGEVAEKFRNYARGSQSHNVILIDGKGQAPGPKVVEKSILDKHWMITEDYDYAWSTFDDFIDLEGEAEHARMVYYQRGEFWIIVDKVVTDQPREIEVLWHWHPELKVSIDGQKVSTQNAYGNLQIIPLNDQVWTIKKIIGQEDPEIQGWYSEEYNKYTPNSATIYSTNIKDTSVFVWLLYPSEKVAQNVRISNNSDNTKELKLKITKEDGNERVVIIPLGW